MTSIEVPCTNTTGSATRGDSTTPATSRQLHAVGVLMLLGSPACDSSLQLAGFGHTAWVHGTGPSEEATITDLSSINDTIAAQSTVIYSEDVITI